MNHTEYWNQRYKDGRGPGDGSRGRLHAFKLDTVQRIVDQYGIRSVVDYGCGDGSQLAGLAIDKYLGVDVSKEAIRRAQTILVPAGMDRMIDCKYLAIDEYLSMPSDAEGWEMFVSLDVLMHLPDGSYEQYMANMFSVASMYVLIYAPNLESPDWKPQPHMFPRKFTDWIEVNTTAKLMEHIPNMYPATEPGVLGTSFSEFFLYEVG